MSDPDKTASLVDSILQTYREHAAAEGAGLPAAEDGEEDQAEDPDCE